MWWCSVNLETRWLDLILCTLGIQYDYTKFEGTAALIPLFSCVIFLKWNLRICFNGTDVECAFQDVLISSFRGSCFRVYRPDKCLLFPSGIDTKRKRSPADNNLHAACSFDSSPHRETPDSPMACKWGHWFKWHFNILTHPLCTALKGCFLGPIGERGAHSRSPR